MAVQALPDRVEYHPAYLARGHADSLETVRILIAPCPLNELLEPGCKSALARDAGPIPASVPFQLDLGESAIVGQFHLGSQDGSYRHLLRRLHSITAMISIPIWDPWGNRTSASYRRRVTQSPPCSQAHEETLISFISIFCDMGTVCKGLAMVQEPAGMTDTTGVWVVP